jgi:PAS domain S-box-containing protein
MLNASFRGRLARVFTRAALTALWALATPPATALDPERPMGQYLVDFWSVSAGLSQDHVQSLLQTRDGYLWVGTRNGLCRFDGVRFTVYDDRSPDQLKDSEVFGLAADEDSSLWIATLGGGLSHLKDGVFTTFSMQDGLPSNELRSVAVAPGGIVWAGSSVGLARLEAGRFVTLTTDDGLPSNNILALHTDPDGVVWIGTDRGLASAKEGRITNHARAHPGELDDAIRAITGGGRPGLWLGLREGGLRHFSEGRIERLTAAQGLRVMALSLDDRGTLSIGTDAGLWLYRKGVLETYSAQAPDGGRQRARLPAQSVLALLSDREGSLWFGTGTLGLGRLRDPLFLNLTGKDPQGQDVAFGVVHEDPSGAIWLGTGGALGQVNGETITVRQLPPGASAEALASERDGTLLVGGSSGLARFRSGSFEPVTPGGEAKLDVVLLFSDAQGGVWVGTRANGAYRFADGKLTRFGPEQGLLGTQVRGIAQDSRGSLWIGTRNGGVSRLQDGKITTFGPEQGLPSPAVQALHVDRADSVWACTRRGLARIKDGRVSTLTAAQGLPANYLFQIREDDEGYIWFSFARGIGRVPRKELDDVADGTASQVSPRLFGMESGLASTMMILAHQPTIWQSQDRRLWFATERGMAVIDPGRLQLRPLPPSTHIEEFRSGGHPQTLQTGMALPPSKGDIEIHYTGLSFLAPERLRFRYRLDGFEDDWQDAGARRVAYYTNLPPGAYRFRVIASTADGVASEQEATHSFTLLPHWYQTRWWLALATFLVLAALSGLGYGLYLWRVEAFKKQQRELAQNVEARTADLKQEISEHQRTEERLERQVAERERAEQETALIAERLRASNSELGSENDQRRRAEQEARQSELIAGRERDLLHALMDNTPDLIYFKDREGLFTRINKAHAEALGLSNPEQAVGRGDADFHEPEFARKLQADERRVIVAGQALVGHVEHDARASRWYLATKVPLVDESGAVTGLVGISKDITERKLSEEKLERDLEAFLVVVEAVAHGDLTRRGTAGSDTLGRIAGSVNRMLDGVAAILTGVRDAAFSVSTSAAEILSSSTQIAKGAEYGTEQVHTTSASAGEMAVSMAEVLRHAEQSAEAAQQVLDHVREGELSVTATAQGMTSIDTAVSATAQKMHLLEVRSKQIFEIIGLLDDIASQSTLLSLNAAIEAAHAGDAGRGFGVVAEEVRRLADRSREATKAVTDIVEGIVDETKLVVEAMAHGVREVHSGRDLSERAQTSLARIQELVERSAALAGHISTASREQAKATQMVSTALQGIANVTEQSRMGAIETSQAVSALVQLADQLTRAISQFKVE